jgi:hypothetical protein
MHSDLDLAINFEYAKKTIIKYRNKISDPAFLGQITKHTKTGCSVS